VSAQLEIVQDADEARERIEADDSVAMVLLHDLADDERDALVRDCAERHIPACYTVDAPRRRRRPGPMKVVFRKRVADEVPAHRVAADTLTAPISEDDEDTGARVSELIAVLALGVMDLHWRMRPAW
jgi:hypothetical protein